jgi:hypothetical protein
VLKTFWLRIFQRRVRRWLRIRCMVLQHPSLLLLRQQRGDKVYWRELMRKNDTRSDESSI